MSAFFNNLKTSFLKNMEENMKLDSAAANQQNNPPDSAPPHSANISDSAQETTAEDQVTVEVLTMSAATNERAPIRPGQLANKFLGFAVKASSKLQEKATSLSAIVSEKTIIGNIEKERQKFIGELGKEKWAKEEAGSLCQLLANPDAQKHIVSISAEAANFTEDPPLSFDLETDIDEIKACACELFMLDPRLKAIRFALVPKQVSEEKFWRNYAYKLSLVKKVVLGEKTQTTTAQSKEPVDGIGAERKESTEGEEDEALEKEFLNDLDEYEVVNGGKKGEAGPGDEEKLAEDELNKEIDALLEEQDGK